MSFRVKRPHHDDAELDITAFMNLMIVLVPVLLMSLVFTRTTILDVNLPDLTGGASSNSKSEANLEVVVTNKGIDVFYPESTLIKRIPLLDEENPDSYDYNTLSLVLQEVKLQLNDKKDVYLRSADSTQYRTLIHTMDALRSFKTVVAGSLVEVELFPEISLGDAS